MKKWIALLSVSLLILGIACSQSKDITISLTNSQGIAVAFDGYYQVNSGTQESMTGTTPWEHTIVMDKGDVLDGQVFKSDTSNVTDTLRVAILIDGNEELTENVILPIVHIAQFHVEVQ